MNMGGLIHAGLEIVAALAGMLAQLRIAIFLSGVAVQFWKQLEKGFNLTVSWKNQEG